MNKYYCCTVNTQPNKEKFLPNAHKKAYRHVFLQKRAPYAKSTDCGLLVDIVNFSPLITHFRAI